MSAIMYLLEDALREERLERRRKRRHLRQQFNINLIPDLEFQEKYRLSRKLFEVLCQDIVPLLPPKATRLGIDPTAKILAALNFYARGNFQGTVGQNMDGPMAQQTVSRCLKDVTNALNAAHIVRKYIKFPQNRNERDLIKQQFYEKYQIPDVIGGIDCTHIAIVRPSLQEEQYFNTKYYYSINTQVICDSNCYITSLNTAYGGANHDSFIWEQCNIKSHLEELENETAYLLGDSGYPLREHMMTPIENAIEDSPEAQYNSLHKRAHSIIERTFEILKGRWRCLLASQELYYCPEMAGKMIIACCVLHNMCVKAGISVPNLTKKELEKERNKQGPTSAMPSISAFHALNAGQRTRTRLVEILNKSVK